jgi:WD repeat-containing protein 61
MGYLSRKKDKDSFMSQTASFFAALICFSNSNGMAIQVVKIRDFIGHSQSVYSIAINRKEKSIYSGGGDRIIVKWKLDEKDGLLVAKQESAIYSLFTDQNYLLCGTQQGLLSIFDSEFKLDKQIKLSEKPIFDITSFKDMYLIVSGDGVLSVLDSSFSIVKSIKLSDLSLRSVLCTKSEIAIACSDSCVYLLDHSFNLMDTLRDHEGTVFSLLYSDENNSLITGGKDARMKKYSENVLEHSIDAHLLHIHTLSLHPDETYFLSGSMDKEIKLWETKTMRLLKVINSSKQEGHTSSVNKILWFDKNNFISCSDDRTIKCFELLT